MSKFKCTFDIYSDIVACYFKSKGTTDVIIRRIKTGRECIYVMNGFLNFFISYKYLFKYKCEDDIIKEIEELIIIKK